jgi:hypothetical protein
LSWAQVLGSSDVGLLHLESSTGWAASSSFHLYQFSPWWFGVAGVETWKMDQQ